MNELLEKEFLDAYQKASSTDFQIPSDVKLRIYAYYKQATLGTLQAESPADNLVKAFKFNAWMQISHLTSEQAKICSFSKSYYCTKRDQPRCSLVFTRRTSDCTHRSNVR